MYKKIFPNVFISMKLPYEVKLINSNVKVDKQAYLIAKYHF